MFGIIGLLVLGYFAKTLFAQKEKPVASTLRDVPMAVTDIKPGTVITADHLGVGRADRTKLSPDVLLANRVIVGRVAREAIKAATPIKAGQLYQPGEQPPLDIAPNMRAVSVEVGDGVAVVDGLIKPGDNVDVLFTAQAGSSTTDNTYQGGLTMRLFEGVKVLAINRNFAQGRVDRGNNHVTLELTEPQTNIIVLTQKSGKITLTYNPNGRGNGGLALSNTERVTLFEILGLEKSDPLKEPYQTEIFRGAGRTTNQFDERGRLIDNGNRNANDNRQKTNYQLPNNNIPSRGTGANDSPNGAQYNPPVPLNTVPSRAINGVLPKLNDQPEQRNAPTAHLPQPRN
jgi:pilus assembly protein CpaB